MSTWNPLNRIVHTLKDALDAAKNSTIFEEQRTRLRRTVASRQASSGAEKTESTDLQTSQSTEVLSEVEGASESPSPSPSPSTAEQLHSPFTFNDLVSFADRVDMAITANHDPYIHVIVDDLAMAITVSKDNTWLLVKSEFPVPPPGLHNLEHIDTHPSTEEIDRQLHLLIDATNEWNSATMYPTAYVDRTGHQWVIRLDTTFFIAGGLTFSQFQSHIDTARFYTRGAISQLPTLIPPV